MSQVRRQGTDDDRPFSRPSPAVRNDATASVPLTGNLIPRDYLGPRPDGQSTRLGSGAAASPLRPTPSPLRTNFHPQSLHRGDPDSPQMSSSPSSANASPFRASPPITQIAHAAFPAPPSRTAPSAYTVPEAIGKGPLESGDQRDGEMTENLNYNLPRKASDTTSAGHPTSSSPMSVVSSLQSISGDRPGQRAMPRTSSIDSAISSLSSAAQSQKSSFDTSALSAADIGKLITAAGSAEAVIVHLLKEKHHAASQNSQLWRLVDKQRTLIFGLNKDLERALKEKDRYKRKVKDLQSSVPPLPTTDQQAVQGRTPEGSDVSANHGSIKQDQAEGSTVPEGTTRDLDLLPALNPRSLVVSPNVPAAFGMQASSNTMPGEDKEKIPPPIRKPPPAPLDLRQAGHAITERHKQQYDSESEYEDIFEVDEVSVDRGRRKTREEDEREREATLGRDGPNGNEFGEGRNNPSRTYDNLENPHDIPMPTRLNSGSRPLTAQFPPVFERVEPAPSSLGYRTTRRASVNERPIISAPKSPGLPLSPRPEDRPFGSPLPRMPREATNSIMPLPISSGDNTSGKGLSPRVVQDQVPRHLASYTIANDAPLDPPSNMHILSIDEAAGMNDPGQPRLPNRGIYQGFMSEEYPNFLLPPNALPLVQVKVSSSRLRPSRNSYTAPRPSDEEPVFTLSVLSRSGNSELWRVEKVIAALPQLDQQIRQLSSFTGRLPDRGLFSGHSPAKVDARRIALNAYFEDLLDTPMDEKAASVICQFLTSDAIEPRDDETSLLKFDTQDKPILRGPDGRPRKEGYLTKRGKNFGGWKARYFVLHGPEFKYFESPGGPHMGTIKIQNAQIGKQSEKIHSQSYSPSRADDDSDNQYRHAFLILEPKKKDSSALVRHVLCAESDEERDAWVEALLEYVEGPLENEGSKSQPLVQEKQTPGTTAKSRVFSGGSKKNGRGIESADMNTPDTVQGFCYDDAVPAEPPILGQPHEKAPLKPSPTAPGSLEPAKATHSFAAEQGQVASHPVISGPSNGTVIQDAGAWGNKVATTTKEKKRSIWGFRTRSSFDLASQVQANHDSPTTSQGSNNALSDRKDIIRPVFGMALEEAVQFCAPQGVDVDLPAVVYRSIEYLEAKEAASEEGIFRLSGSNVVVKALKERFNTEGDVDLLGGDQYYDVHAVASLFKQYLRELPTTVLTRELHLEFLRVLGKHMASVYRVYNSRLLTLESRTR